MNKKIKSIFLSGMFLYSFIYIVIFIFCLIFDKQLFLFFRNFNIYLWSLFDIFFSTKFWLVYVFIVGIYIAIKNKRRIRNFFEEFKKNDNKKKFLLNLFEKSRNSIFFVIVYSVFISIFLSLILKYIIGRQRPVFFEALDMSGFYPFTLDWAFNSMPSGHTSTSFSILMMLTNFNKKLNILIYLIAIIIGISRVCFGAHWLSDVVLGALIGTLSSYISYKYIYRKK